VDPHRVACHRHRVRRVSIVLVLLASSAAASVDPFLDTGFGKAEAGLQLALIVPAGGTEATFRVKNTGTRTVTFPTFYTCSGWPFSIAMGASSTQLDHHFDLWGHDPKYKALAKPGEGCTRNVPDKLRTVAPGDTIAIVVPFATPGELTKSTEKAFQASAVLHLEGRAGAVELHSAVQIR
jgi:hypothetical protein